MGHPERGRDGKWKAVRQDYIWELYDLSTDRNETHDLAAEHPEQLAALATQWEAWNVAVSRDD